MTANPTRFRPSKPLAIRGASIDDNAMGGNNPSLFQNDSSLFGKMNSLSTKWTVWMSNPGTLRLASFQIRL